MRREVPGRRVRGFAAGLRDRRGGFASRLEVVLVTEQNQHSSLRAYLFTDGEPMVDAHALLDALEEQLETRDAGWLEVVEEAYERLIAGDTVAARLTLSAAISGERDEEPPTPDHFEGNAAANIAGGRIDVHGDYPGNYGPDFA